MATYYLNADIGNDTTGAGTSGSPWKTVSKAHTSATSGDTIICQESTATYTFATQIFTKNLNIYGVNTDASGVVFDAAAAVRWHTNATPTIVLDIKYITFQNATKPSDGTYQNIISSHLITVSNCVFKDIIHPTGSGSSASGGIVGAEYKSGAQANAVLVQNCLFYNLTGGSPTISISLHSLDTGTHYWYNNTIYADGTYTTGNIFCHAALSSVDMRIKNNIIYSTSSVAFNSGAGTPTFQYNSTYNLTGVPSGTGNITSDPLFVDGPNKNFNLRPASPCIDTGILL